MLPEQIKTVVSIVLQQLLGMSNLGSQQQILLLLQLLVCFTIVSPDAHLLACICC